MSRNLALLMLFFSSVAAAQEPVFPEWPMKQGKPKEGVLHSIDESGKTVTLLLPKTFRLNQFDEPTQAKILAELNARKDSADQDKKFAEESAIRKKEMDEINASIDKEYHRRLEMTGSGKKQSDTFIVTGGPTVIHWEFYPTSKLADALHVSVYSEKTNEVVDLAVNETRGPKNDSSRIRLPPGAYYLKVNSLNCDWKIMIFEKKADPPKEK